jgi:hypothetical protein
MTDSSFLSQLEQRTQQVKITLANLEAERVRIENQISALQPLVPHYDALLNAERQLLDSNVQLEDAPHEEAAQAGFPEPQPEASQEGQNGGYQEQQPSEHPWG